MLAEELGIALGGSLLIGANIGLVVIEIDVLDILAEQILVTRSCGNRRRRWRRLGDGEARSRLLRSARTFGYQVIGGGIGRADRLRSTGLNGSDAINGNVGSVRSLPGQSRRLTSLNRIRTHRDGSGRRCRWRRWWGRRWRGLLLAGAEHENSGQSDDGCEYLQMLLFHVLPLHV